MKSLDLNLWWMKFNQDLFQGEMDRPVILAYRQMIYSLDEANNKGYMFGCYQSTANIGGTQGEMLIWVNVADGDILDTLLHEMCHQYVREVLDDEEADMHGPEFQEIHDEVMQKAEKLYGNYPKSTSIVDTCDSGNHEPNSIKVICREGAPISGLFHKCIMQSSTRYNDIVILWTPATKNKTATRMGGAGQDP